MEIFLTLRADKTLLAIAAQLLDIGQQIIQKENQIMATLQDDIDAIAAQTTAVDSLASFIHGLQDQIANLPGITPAQQAQIDDIFTKVTANTGTISAAMQINVPPAPPPTEVPPVV